MLKASSIFFVNTARAGLIAPGALADALETKKIAGAALDAFDEEPIPADDALTKFPNVVLTPHNAGMTPEATQTGLMMTVDNVADFLVEKGIHPDYLVVKGSR